MNDLDPIIREKVDQLFIEAGKTFDSGNKSAGLELAEKAWSVIPSPKFDWDVSLSFTQTMACFYRDSELYEKAIELMGDLIREKELKPHQDGPFFTLGTIYFEKGDLDQSFKNLDKANKISKGRCFRNGDKKYLDFYKLRSGV